MITTTPLYISPKGGSIICFKGDNGRLFQSCSSSHCVYARNLHSAKVYLDDLESNKILSHSETAEIPIQCKTTLKWNSSGELLAVDMARILDRIRTPELTICELVYGLDYSSLQHQKKPHQCALPSSSWIP